MILLFVFLALIGTIVCIFLGNNFIKKYQSKKLAETIAQNKFNNFIKKNLK